MRDFTVLVLPGAYATSVAVTLDILNAAAALAPRLKTPRPTWRVLSPDGGVTPLGGGFSVQTAMLPTRSRSDASVWVAPGMGMVSSSAVADRLAHDDAQRAAQALARHVARGGRVAASCSAVFLLHAAGLLSGRRATTSWWLASDLRRAAPECIVDADRMLCVDGQVITAGAAFAQSDLMLHLLRSRFGVALADAVGRVLLIDGRQAQAAFVLPSMVAGGDELVRKLTRRIESSLPAPPSVVDLANEFAMSPRTLARRVQAATGKGPLALVQSVRLNRARSLIEGSRMTIEQIASEVGYQDATALRRLMLKSAGANPGKFRPGTYAS